MNAFWHYYVLTFKRIFGNGSVLVTMILSVVFYSFFILQPTNRNKEAYCQ